MSGDGSTAGMWLRMLGLEPLWQAANSADVQKQMMALVQAILETRVRCERMERKLDSLLLAGGNNAGVNANSQPITRLPAIRSTARPGDGPIAGISPDTGTGGDTPEVDDSGPGVRLSGHVAGTTGQ